MCGSQRCHSRLQVLHHRRQDLVPISKHHEAGVSGPRFRDGGHLELEGAEEPLHALGAAKVGHREFEAIGEELPREDGLELAGPGSHQCLADDVLPIGQARSQRLDGLPELALLGGSRFGHWDLALPIGWRLGCLLRWQRCRQWSISAGSSKRHGSLIAVIMPIMPFMLFMLFILNFRKRLRLLADMNMGLDP